MLSFAAPAIPARRGLRARITELSLGDAAIAVVLAVAASFVLVPTKDPDLFWHLGAGRWIVRHHRVPRVDPFSWTAPGRRWIAHEWLTETLFWGVHRLGGYALLSITLAIVVAAAMGLTARTMRRLGLSSGAAAAWTLLGSLVGLPTWAVRPQMLSFALLALVTAWTTDAWRSESDTSRRRLWVLPLVSLVWANLHGGYVFGLAVLGAFAVGTTVDARRGRTSAALARTAWAVTLACGAVTLVNPNGLTGFTYPFSYLGDNASTRYVAEWFAPDFSSPDYWPLALLLVVAAAGLVRARRRLPVHAWLQVLALGALAVQSIRNCSPFVAVALPWIAWAHHQRPPKLRAHGPKGAGIVHATLVAAAVLALGVRGGAAVSAANQDDVHRATFPVEAVRWMQAHPSGQVMNRYDWGGWLILAAPDIPVGVDGRPDMYGDAFMDRYVATWQTTEGWRDRLRADGYRRVLGATDDPIVRALADEPGWTVVYRDAVAVVVDRAAD